MHPVFKSRGDPRYSIHGVRSQGPPGTRNHIAADYYRIEAIARPQYLFLIFVQTINYKGSYSLNQWQSE